jgi:hypothetical protein
VLLRTATAGVCAAALAAALAACGAGGSSDNGVSSKSPEGIVTAASQAVKSAKSVHVSGSTTSSGSPIKLDLNLVSGQGGEGEMSIGGASFQIVEIGPTVYVKAGSAFWNQFGNAQAAQLLSGRWLKAPSSGKFSSFAELTNQTKLFQQLLSQHGTLSKGASSTVSGQKVIAVLDKSRGGTLYVATTGKPYPVAIAKGGSDGGRITFDRIDEKVSLKAPSGAIALPASAT